MPKATTKSDKKKFRDLENWARHIEKERFGGLNRSERRKLEKIGVDLEKTFLGLITDWMRDNEAQTLREKLRREYPAWLEEQAKLEKEAMSRA